jgi:cyanuric acid amidohydrolase
VHADEGVQAERAATPAATPAGRSRLAVGTAFSRAFQPEEVGRLAQVEATASAVALAIENAGIGCLDDVHWVQIKCPLLTADRVAEAKARGQTTVTDETYKSMAYSRAASALGVAVALGEVDGARLGESAIGRDASLWSGRASASAGIELMRNEVLVFGNAERWIGDAVIAHAVMHDPIDIAAVRSVLRALGFEPGDQLGEADSQRVLAVLAKAEPSRDGLIRRHRHIMWDDSDINATRHGRAVVGGVVSAAIGHPAIFVSGGAEHQGPDGGGPIAIIARTGEAGRTHEKPERAET